MLSISWLIAAWIARGLHVPAALSPRAVMGASGLVVLMTAEFGVGALIFRRDLAGQVRAWASPAGSIGLGCQVAFSLIPASQILIRAR
jgi:hypothetical protein